MYLQTGILVLFATFVCFKIFQSFSSQRRNLPGPSWALPLLGHLLQVGRNPHHAFKRWRSRYGPIVSWKMGSKKALVLSDAKLIREMFGKEVASGRDYSPIFDILTGRTGVVTCDGRGSSEQRSFAIKTFRELGFVKGGTLENIILEEGQRLVKYFEGRAEAESEVKINGVFNGAVLNNMWTILSGEKHDWTTASDQEHVEIFENFNRCLSTVAGNGLVIAPWLRHIIPGLSGWRDWAKATVDYGRMVENAITKREASKGDGASASDYIGQFLEHMEGVSDPESSFYKETGRKNLRGSTIELLNAGAETTGAALEFGMLYLAHHPQVQEELQKELDSVVGSSRLPSLLDKLPYLEAVVWEVLRLASQVPFGVPHRLMEAVDDFHGYSIPKDTVVFADIYNVNHDPESWTLPEEFNPSRFLNNERGELSRTESVVSFSFGRRRCVGEGLARSIMFLFLGSIFQRFGVEPAANDKGYYCMDDAVPGIIIRPQPFKVVFKPRT